MIHTHLGYSTLRLKIIIIWLPLLIFFHCSIAIVVVLMMTQLSRYDFSFIGVFCLLAHIILFLVVVVFFYYFWFHWNSVIRTRTCAVSFLMELNVANERRDRIDGCYYKLSANSFHIIWYIMCYDRIILYIYINIDFMCYIISIWAYIWYISRV